MTRPLILVAASGLAREVLAAVRAGSDQSVIGFVDDDPSLHGRVIDGVPVLGGVDVAIRHASAGIVVCAGSGLARERIAGRLSDGGVADDRHVAFVHPHVHVPSSCSIASGAIILGQVAMTTSISIGRHVVLMPGVVLTHDDVVEDFATLCAGVVLGGSVIIRRSAYLGMNSSVREQLVVGERSVLGMGSVLLSPLPADETWVGVPARPLRKRMPADEGPLPDAAAGAPR